MARMTYEQAIKIIKHEQYASPTEKAEAERMAVEAMRKQVEKEVNLKRYAERLKDIHHKIADLVWNIEKESDEK